MNIVNAVSTLGLKQLTKAKIPNELIRQFSQSISYRASQFTQLSCVLTLACAFGQTFGATDFSCAVSGFSQSREVKYFYHRC